jgi:hypothetical protein
VCSLARAQRTEKAMNFSLMALTVLTGCNGAFAHSNVVSAPGRVTVCVQNAANEYDIGNAELIASRMFVSARVIVDWQHPFGSCEGVVLAIVVDLAATTAKRSGPMALAQANMGEGGCIEVFAERIDSISSALHSLVLAHVLVHEITHIIQGVPRHSESGIMKARWGMDDYNEMRWRPLRFTPEDIELIRLGLVARAGRRTTATQHLPNQKGD